VHDLLVPVVLEQTDSVIFITEIRLWQQAEGMELKLKSGCDTICCDLVILSCGHLAADRNKPTNCAA
jgi:hypothetical protein